MISRQTSRKDRSSIVILDLFFNRTCLKKIFTHKKKIFNPHILNHSEVVCCVATFPISRSEVPNNTIILSAIISLTESYCYLWRTIQKCIEIFLYWCRSHNIIVFHTFSLYLAKELSLIIHLITQWLINMNGSAWKGN